MELKYILESLLFASGHPLSCKKLAEILSSCGESPERGEINETEIENCLNELAQDYKDNNRGLQLVFLDGKAQLATASESKQMIEKLIKSDFEEDLSQAALETLAIIAYRGPISRVQIENLRGVNCSFILQNLAIRGLIDRKNNPIDGRSYIYNVTFDFLKYLGVNKLDELPNYNERK